MRAAPDSAIPREALLKRQQEQLYTHAFRVPYFNILLAVFLFGTQQWVFEKDYLLWWAIVVSAISLVRLAVAMAYRKRLFPSLSPKRWIDLYVYLMLMSGLAWGASVFFVPQYELELHFMTLFVVAGVMSGAMPMVAIVRNAYPLYAALMLLPYVVQYVYFGTSVYLTIIAFTAIFGVFMALSSRETYQHYMKTLRLQIAEQRNARQDMLTGIANRRAFQEIYDDEWKRAQRAGYPLSVMLVDIDDFKKYNDHYGHIMGDECLQRVATTISDALERQTDTVARYGGEEFSLILPSTGAQAGRMLAEQLRTAVASLAIPHAHSRAADHVTISIGGSTCIPSMQLAPSDLLAAADDQLYASKRGGRNQATWDSHLDAESQ